MHQFQQFQGPGIGGAAAGAFMALHGFRDLPPDGENRVKRRHGFLEDHGHIAAAEISQLALIHGLHIAPAHLDFAGHLRGFGQKLHQGAERDRFAGT